MNSSQVNRARPLLPRAVGTGKAHSRRTGRREGLPTAREPIRGSQVSLLVQVAFQFNWIQIPTICF